MSKLLKPLQTTEREFVLMYDEYIKELSKYSDALKKCNIGDSLETYLKYRSESFTRIYRIYSNSGEIQGFMILGVAPNTHPDTDYFIQEFYIKKKFRKKHIGMNYILDFIKNHPGRYCLFILDKNEPAKHFWFKTFNKAGFVPVGLSDVGCCPLFATQYGFIPNERSLKNEKEN